MALGCVIRGETYHFEIVAGESARGMMDLAIGRRLAIGNGILTVDTEAQALARASAGDGDKGGGAAKACLAVIARAQTPPARHAAYERSRLRRQARSVARLAAVQALYQMETAGAGVEAVIREFTDHRFDRDLEGETLAARRRGVLRRPGARRGRRAGPMSTRRSAAGSPTGWRLDRIDATARSILRAGAFELMRRPDVPAEVAIDEYVEIAKSLLRRPGARLRQRRPGRHRPR